MYVHVYMHAYAYMCAMVESDMCACAHEYFCKGSISLCLCVQKCPCLCRYACGSDTEMLALTSYLPTPVHASVRGMHLRLSPG